MFDNYKLYFYCKSSTVYDKHKIHTGVDFRNPTSWARCRMAWRHLRSTATRATTTGSSRRSADEAASSGRIGTQNCFFAYTYVTVLGLMRCLIFPKILIRLSKLCVQNKKCRNQHQRLLKNMGAHSVVLDLLQIPYEKVCPVLLSVFNWNISPSH